MKKKATSRKRLHHKPAGKRTIVKRWRLFWVSLGLAALLIIPLAQFANNTKNTVVLGVSVSKSKAENAKTANLTPTINITPTTPKTQ